MNLDSIKNNTTWEDAASSINSNFSKTNLEVAKIAASSVKHKGYFTTEAALLAAQPSPKVGDNAYVGATYPGVVYVCNITGVWTATTTVPSPPAVTLSEYYKKTETDAIVGAVESNITSLETDLKQKINANVPMIGNNGLTNNLIDTISEYPNSSTSSMYRANNITGIFKGIEIYLTNSGTIEYGLININTGYYDKIGEVYLTFGKHTVLFGKYYDCTSEYRILVRSTIDNYAYIGGTASNGVGMYEYVSGTISLHGSWELAYNCISINAIELEDRVEEIESKNNISQEKTYYKTNSDLNEIIQFPGATNLQYRANVFYGNIIGLLVYAINNGYIEYGIIDSKTLTATKIGSKFLYKGENIIGLSEIIKCDSEQQIYINSTQPDIVAGNSTNGIGMWELSNGSFNKFSTWELAYYGIKSFDFDYYEKVSSSVEIEYGEIIIPPSIHVIQSYPITLYWSNIANIPEGDIRVYFETTCDIGRNTERGYVIGDDETPTLGTHILKIVCRNYNTRKILSEKEINIIVVSPDNGSGIKNILMIGDSRTWQSISSDNGENGRPAMNYFTSSSNKTITTEVLTLTDANNGVKLNMIGDYASPINSLVRNMAESGRTFGWAIQHLTDAGGVISYCESNGLAVGESLNYATIMYGINDLNDWGNEDQGQYERGVLKIDSILNNAKTLIDMIHAAYPLCNIILIIEPTTCASQDGWGYWEGAQDLRKSNDEVELLLKTFRKRLLAYFEGYGIGSFLTFCGAGLFLDRLYGFPYVVTPESARCQTKKKDKFFNCVHPFNDGYRQIADGIFSTIKWLGNL